VLLGLILVTNLAIKRNLDPLTLSLSQLNKDVTTEPKNPVFYNSPEDPFVCQPGSCSYSNPWVQVAQTNEQYLFCGYQGRIMEEVFNATPTCSGSVATGIMDFFDSGASVQTLVDASNIENVSN
jgi:hypothetical protein